MMAKQPSNGLLTHRAGRAAGFYPLVRSIFISLTLVLVVSVLCLGQVRHIVSSSSFTNSIVSLAIDPQTPSILYAGTYQNVLFKTMNNGDTWNSSSNGLAFDAVALDIDPTTTTTLYAGTTNNTDPLNPQPGAVYKSIDGGNNWNVTTLANRFITSIRIDPIMTSTIWAGSVDVNSMGIIGGVSKSTNSGSTWTDKNTGLPLTPRVTSLAIDPLNTLTVYAGTNAGVFKRTTAEGSWNAMNTGLASLNVRTLAVHPTTTTILYEGSANSAEGQTNGGVSKSTDGGTNWTPVGLFGFNVSQVVIDRTTPTTIYATANANGVYKSTDSGGTWNAINTGLTGLSATCLVIDPATPTRLYVGTNGGVYRSLDAGATWQITGQGIKRLHNQITSQ